MASERTAVAYGEDVIGPWTDLPPATLNRHAELRREGVPPDARAVLVSSRGVVMSDGEVVTVAADDRPPSLLNVYIGRHHRTDYCAVVPEDLDAGVPGTWTGLRDIIASPVSALHRELAVTATAMERWHDMNRHCDRCGGHTRAAEAGWVRRCEACAADVYPRTDPAVIVAITDQDDRLLLAHGTHWSARRYSHVAGYVEPGESLEQAVHREVSEEVSLAVSDVTYVGSQPWPFPGSVMVGFAACAVTTNVVVDGDEVDDARFFTRDQVNEAVAGGDIILAPLGSIARTMIDQWLHPVDGAPGRTHS